MESLSELDQKILQISQKYPDGIDDGKLTSLLKNVSQDEKLQSLNYLIETYRILLLQNGYGVPVYKYQSEEDSQNLRGLTEEEILVFQIIKEAGDRGIWNTDIKSKLMGQVKSADQIRRLTTSLYKKEKIKKVETNQKNKYVWMLMHTEPNFDIVPNSFDPEAMDVIADRIVDYVKDKGNVSYKELLVYIKQTGLMQQGEMTDRHIDKIIQVMVYDKKIEVLSGKDTNRVYRSCNQEYPNQVIAPQMPCNHCPVRRECAPGNVINPKDCVYLSQWVQIEF